MTAAFDLAKKGYAVVVFEKGPRLGGQPVELSGRKAPGKIIAEDLQVLERVGVEVRLNTTVEGCSLI